MPANRPSLEYQILFDYCAGAAARRGRAAILAQSDFYRRELLGRLPDNAALLTTNSQEVSTVIWADGDFRLHGDPLAADSQLWVIQPGMLARFLAYPPPPKTLPAGYRVLDSIGFHGWRSIFWSQLHGLLNRVGRYDLADRCLQAMRAAYTVTGQGAPQSTLYLQIAGREA